MNAGEAIAVVIPSWNSLELLPACLDSLRRQSRNLELLVVDNGSRDGTLEYLRSAGIPHLSLPRNVGFARAVNLGVSKTTAGAVLILNVDTMLEPGCVEHLRAALVADPWLGGVQPSILQMEGDSPGEVAGALLYSAGQALTGDGRAFEVGAGCRQRPDLLRRQEIFGVCGAACLLRRELFDQLGGYDERYVSFYEDVDLNVRARIAGWRFALAPKAVVWHVGNASWSVGFVSPGAENARLVARNRLATQFKFMPARALPKIAMVEAGALFRALRRRRLFPTLQGKLEALTWLPSLAEERRRLRREGSLEEPRSWLGR